GSIAKVGFLSVLGLLNFLFLILLRRPAATALVSLVFIVALIAVSQFKYDKLWMTVDFVDLMIIDQDTSAFLLTMIPSLRLSIGLLAIITVALSAVTWWLDPFRVRVGT